MQAARRHGGARVILVVDDLRHWPAADGVVYARTYAEAIRLLGSLGDIAQLWLDHDLGEEKSGYDVAIWLEERAVSGRLVRIDRVVVHSQNPVGVRRIVAALEPHYEVVVLPFEAGPGSLEAIS